MPKKLELAGQRFGRLTVIKEDPERDSWGGVKWICKCDCGKIVSVLGNSLKKGATQSCGCLQREKVIESNKIDLTGQRFGRLTVLKEDTEKGNQGQTKWICKCDCGNVVSILGQSLKSGNTKSCGCLYIEQSKLDLTGQRFGRLTVIAEDPKRGSNHQVKWLCRCECGNTVFVSTANLRGSHTQSCGCLQREKANESNKIDLTGQRFGRLTVIKEYPERDSREQIKWLCQCDCGKTVPVAGDYLRRGTTQSCGCLHKETSIVNALKYHIDNTNVTEIMPDRKLNSNNTSGKRGVYWNKRNNKWVVSIDFKKKRYYLGYYDDFNEACKARDRAEEHLFGDFLAWYAEAYPEKWAQLEKRREENARQTDPRVDAGNEPAES